MLNFYVEEYHIEERTMRMALVAVSRDMRHLQGYLDETAEMVSSEDDEGRSGKTLTLVARAFARKLGQIAGWLEWELGVSPAPTERRAAPDPAED
jgi:hypothetical protein